MEIAISSINGNKLEIKILSMIEMKVSYGFSLFLFSIAIVLQKSSQLIKNWNPLLEILLKNYNQYLILASISTLDKVTYVLHASISRSLVVEKNNIVNYYYREKPWKCLYRESK